MRVQMPAADVAPDEAEPAPLSRYCLVRTSELSRAENEGAQLLSENHLRIRPGDALDARIHGVSLGPVSLYYMKYGAELEVLAPPLGDYVALTLPIEGTMQLRQAGHEFSVAAGSSAGVISPDQDLRMKWSPGFAMLCARLELSALTAFARQLAPDAGEPQLGFTPVVSRPAALAAVWGAVSLMQDMFERVDASERVAPMIAAQLREQLMATLLMVQPNNYSAALLAQPRSVSRCAVQEAVDLIESSPEAPLTVASMARAVNVSPRALQMGFRRQLSTSPAAYLTEVRLTRARRDLISAVPSDGTTVAGIAMRWGFTHPGRFAAYYRRRYGEAPSTTLARNG